LRVFFKFMLFFKKNYYWRIFFIGGFLMLFFLVSFRRENEIKFLQTPIFFLLKKPASFFSITGNWLGEKIDFLASIGDIKKLNEKLFIENLELKSQVAEMKEVRNENIQLRKELGLKQKENLNAQAALVVAERLENGQALLFIDKGTESGIAEGDVVLASQKFLLGRIKKVFWGGAEVELIFNSNFLVGVEIQDQEIPGVVQGVRGITAVLDKVTKASEIKTGQAVVTSGLGGEFPRGFLVGFVGEELENSGSLFRRFSLEMPLEIERIRLVWVIK